MAVWWKIWCELIALKRNGSLFCKTGCWPGLKILQSLRARSSMTFNPRVQVVGIGPRIPTGGNFCAFEIVAVPFLVNYYVCLVYDLPYPTRASFFRSILFQFFSVQQAPTPFGNVILERQAMLSYFSRQTMLSKVSYKVVQGLARQTPGPWCLDIVQHYILRII